MTSLPLARVFQRFFYIHTRFRFALIGRYMTAQLTGSHKEIGIGIQILETYLQALFPFPALLPEFPRRLVHRLQ